jgi:hypothetical protein
MTTSWRHTLSQGLIAGIIGFATVAVVLAVANIAGGRSPFYSANVLGSVLFYDVTDPASVPVTVLPVLAYTAIHLAVFVAFGLVAAALAALSDRGWQLWFVGLFFMIFISFHMFAAVQLLAAPARTVLSEAMIWVAGVAASIAMIGYLVRAHPGMRTGQPW